MRPVITLLVLSLAVLGLASCAEEEPSELDPAVVEDPPVEPEDDAPADEAPADEAPADEEGEERGFEVDLQPLNGSDVTGMATLVEDPSGESIDVTISAEGLVAGQTHGQHIHMPEGDAEGTCPPPSADEDEDGIITLSEGVPFYGPVALPLEPFPVPAEGELDFAETYGAADELDPLDQGVIVLHGGEVDGEYQAELPVACGEIGA